MSYFTLVTGEKLPWTVQLGDWSVYTLHAGRECQQLLEGMSITCTLGASAQYNPPTSDNIQALALCVHIDISPPIFAISPPQVKFTLPTITNYFSLIGNFTVLTTTNYFVFHRYILHFHNCKLVFSSQNVIFSKPLFRFFFIDEFDFFHHVLF